MSDLFWSRKARVGPENDMVNEFLEQYRTVFNYSDLTTSIYTEPCLGAGFPDVLLVFWDRSGLVRWNGARQSLTKTDIKILHFIAQSSAVNDQSINERLGFGLTRIRKSLKALEMAEVVTITDGVATIHDLSKAFFVKNIISIEAKIGNWRTALLQAQMNQLFASESYVMMPKSNISQNFSAALTDSMAGLVEFTDNRFSIGKAARLNPIPASYSSWIVNESIGRDAFGV